MARARSIGSQLSRWFAGTRDGTANAGDMYKTFALLTAVALLVPDEGGGGDGEGGGSGGGDGDE